MFLTHSWSVSLKMIWTAKAQWVVSSCKVWHLSHLWCMRKSQIYKVFLPCWSAGWSARHRFVTLSQIFDVSQKPHAVHSRNWLTKQKHHNTTSDDDHVLDLWQTCMSFLVSVVYCSLALEIMQLFSPMLTFFLKQNLYESVQFQNVNNPIQIWRWRNAESVSMASKNNFTNLKTDPNEPKWAG